MRTSSIHAVMLESEPRMSQLKPGTLFIQQKEAQMKLEQMTQREPEFRVYLRDKMFEVNSHQTDRGMPDEQREADWYALLWDKLQGVFYPWSSRFWDTDVAALEGPEVDWVASVFEDEIIKMATEEHLNVAYLLNWKG